MQNQATYYTKLSVKDYHPFGMQMPGRSKPAQSGEEYRFGFNGKEQDKEGMGGGGSTYDYGFRIYNPQLGKFLSVDPLSASYPWYTPYQFAGNKPTIAIDLDGLEEFITVDKQGNPTFALYISDAVSIGLEVVKGTLQQSCDNISLSLALKKIKTGELVGSNGRIYSSTRFKDATYGNITYSRGIDKGNQSFSTKKINQIAAQQSKGASGIFSKLAKYSTLIDVLFDFANAGVHADENNVPDVRVFVPGSSAILEQQSGYDDLIIQQSIENGPESVKKLVDNSTVGNNFMYLEVNDETLLKVLEGGYDNIDDLMGNSYTSVDNSNLLFIQKGENDSFILRATYVDVDDDSTNK